MAENQYDLSKGRWVLYGVLNESACHELRFIAQTDDPELLAEENTEYVACAAYDLTTMRQFDRDPPEPGIFIHHGLGRES